MSHSVSHKHPNLPGGAVFATDPPAHDSFVGLVLLFHWIPRGLHDSETSDVLKTLQNDPSLPPLLPLRRDHTRLVKSRFLEPLPRPWLPWRVSGRGLARPGAAGLKSPSRCVASNGWATPLRPATSCARWGAESGRPTRRVGGWMELEVVSFAWRLPLRSLRSFMILFILCPFLWLNN